MIHNYLKVALRALRKSGLHSVITISSLAIGITASLAIVLFIQDELAFDDFPDKQQIYRLNEVQSFTGTNTQHVALSMPGMGPAILQDYPTQVLKYSRFWNWGTRLLQQGEQEMIVENVAVVDSAFIDIFPYVLDFGDAETALDPPYSILLKAHIAQNLFGSSSDAMGQTLVMSETEYKVTGILPSETYASHLQFSALVSSGSVLANVPDYNDQWGSNYLNTYLLVDPDANIAAMEESFPEFLVRRMENEEINDYYKLYLQPLSDVHLQSMNVEHDYNNYRKFNGAYINIFTIIAVVILLIASVNFMNLSIARAGFRWKEIGVRKSVGAVRKQVFSQFMVESFFLTISAFLIAMILLLILIPLLNSMIGRELSVLSLFQHPKELFITLLGTILLATISGIYPSIFMSSLATSTVLKGGKKKAGKSLFRNALIITQYAMAVAMIIGTIVVVQQISFMKNTDIGYDTEQMMLVSMNDEANENFESLKNELLNSPYVEGVTATGQRMGNNLHQWGFKVKTDTAIIDITPSNVAVDIDFLDVYRIEVLDGRGFSKDYPTDNDMAFVINQKLADELGLDNVPGTQAGHGWYHNDSLGTIIGVVSNFNFNSLHFDVNTLAMAVHPDWGFDEMSVRIKADQVPEAISEVRQIYESMVSDWPFTYSFLDEHFEAIYRSDQQMSFVVSLMAMLSIFIACMGLFGLAQLESQYRTKEVGIRKVLGASENQIIRLLSRNFALLVALGFIIASPVAYFALTGWLEGFAYRISIEWWVFPIAGFIALAVALGTIAIHAYRAAVANPTESLRYE